jgi:transcriptional regulator with XRE-family HTH domain
MKPRSTLLTPELLRRVDERRRCTGVVVAQLRAEKGWTQEELAKRASVAPRWLKALESNQLPRNYRLGTQFKVVEALGFGVYELKDFMGLVEDMVNKILAEGVVR